MAWTDERIALLKKLYVDEGLSASQIADRIGGTTRNAVIGKVTRLGLVKSVDEQTKRARARTAMRIAKPIPKVKPQGWFWAGPGKKIPSPEVLAETRAKTAALDAMIAPESRRKLVDLEPQHCRFPLGEVGTPEFGFCPADRDPGVPYCRDHAMRCFDTPQPVTRTARKPLVVTEPANDTDTVPFLDPVEA